MCDAGVLGNGTPPRLSVPSLPPGVGANTGPTYITNVDIHVSGNLSTRENTQELARILAPEISYRMAARASGVRALKGR